MEELDRKFDAEGNMIDWRRRFINQGRAEGRAEGLAEGQAKGLAEGKAKGLAEGRLSILQQVLHGKFDVISAAQLAKVLEHRDEPDLCTRIIKANSVDELLQSLC